MTKHFLTILAFIAISIGSIALSRLVFHSDHFKTLPFLRPNSFMTMTLLVLLIQGAVMSTALTAWRGALVTLSDGISVSLSFGLFFVAYTALGEPAKFTVPSVPIWILAEVGTAMVQFGLFGLIMGWIHNRLP